MARRQPGPHAKALWIRRPQAVDNADDTPAIALGVETWLKGAVVRVDTKCMNERLSDCLSVTLSALIAEVFSDNAEDPCFMPIGLSDAFAAAS